MPLYYSFHIIYIHKNCNEIVTLKLEYTLSENIRQEIHKINKVLKNFRIVLLHTHKNSMADLQSSFDCFISTASKLSIDMWIK